MKSPGLDALMGYRPVVELTRGEMVESIHFGSIAVADIYGKLHAWWGDPEIVTYLRSSAKPFQALPLLESGAAVHYGLSTNQIAVICASHSGTDEHVRTVISVQEQTGLVEDQLQCGIHPPFDKDTAQRLEREGLQPTPNHHNCSGKHTGMLALASFQGESILDYLDPNHPVQRQILRTFAEMCGLAQEEIVLGTDGCSAPNFAAPIRAAATAFARLVDPSELAPPRADACRRVAEAMTGHPSLVAGPARFDTRLMEVTSGRILAKGGAEGYQGLGVPAGMKGRGSKALGVVIKIADGDHGHRAREIVLLAVLEALGVIREEEKEDLTEFRPRVLTNHRGMTVGHVRPCFQLERGT